MKVELIVEEKFGGLKVFTDMGAALRYLMELKQPDFSNTIIGTKTPDEELNWMDTFYQELNKGDFEPSPSQLADHVEEILCNSEELDQLESALDKLSLLAWAIADVKGFHDSDRTFSEEIALMHSELSEALEAARQPANSDKLEGYSGIEEELADLIIRVLDSSRHRNLDLSGALLAKLSYNMTRAYKHGKQF